VRKAFREGSDNFWVWVRVPHAHTTCDKASACWRGDGIGVPIKRNYYDILRPNYHARTEFTENNSLVVIAWVENCDYCVVRLRK